MANRRILKYQLNQEQYQIVDLPETWRPIRFGNQAGTPTIWAEADLQSPIIPRVVTLAFTGDDVPSGRYIGTAMFGVGGELVIHCYVK